MKFYLLTASFLFTSACFAESFESEAKKSLMPFKKALMGKLKGAMKKGAFHAVGMCNLESPKLTQEAETTKFVIGRTSNKYRNAKNSPKAWMVDILSKYEVSTIKNKIKPSVVELKNGKRVYVEPIYMKGLCLNCHGKGVSQKIKTVILEKYPHDKAMGYKSGQFRGLFWVEEK